jgi:hypothetical protein
MAEKERRCLNPPVTRLKDLPYAAARLPARRDGSGDVASPYAFGNMDRGDRLWVLVSGLCWAIADVLGEAAFDFFHLLNRRDDK